MLSHPISGVKCRMRKDARPAGRPADCGAGQLSGVGWGWTRAGWGPKVDLMARSASLKVVDTFLGREARALRAHFEGRMGDPKAATPQRFVWDWWHVPGQYTLLRTPAANFFPPELLARFTGKLGKWGRENLGCPEVSPPWLSLYVDGCRQELHGDLPHGPWAYVHSLTPWKGRPFRGGETLLLKDEVLDHWRRFDSGSGMEEEEIFRVVPALFDRLTVFDPRIPHGVRRVEGVADPLAGRLVLHGWFQKPRPVIEGPLKATQLRALIQSVSSEAGVWVGAGGSAQGLLSFEFKVGLGGRVTALRLLSDTLRERGNGAGPSSLAALRLRLSACLGSSDLGRQRGTSKVLLPLFFD
jgi:hypothetical protein